MSERRGRREELRQSGRFNDIRRLMAWAASAVGIGLAVLGMVAVDISMEVLGLLAGLVGYALGARVLGTIAIVLSVAMMLLVLAITRGYIPGIEPTYPGVF